MMVSLWAILFFCGGDADASFGYLAPPKKTDAIVYRPREGDLVFYDDRSLFWNVLFHWAGTGPPLHVGIVFKQKDGTLAVLEAGPDDTISVAIRDLGTRLSGFDKDGTIAIRRCKRALTAGQSAALTRFALAQDGKPYAVARLLIQGTPFRTRGLIRETFLGRTDLDRPSWICSELTVAAGTVAGLFPDSVKSNVTYPRDIIDNRRHDLSAVWHDAEIWRPNR